jgi:predicted outer membrane repeat protein
MKTFILVCCCALAVSMAQGQIIYVPGPDSLTIQQGIELANSGDTVLVANGTYNERISFMGKKPLTVASEFILDGDWSHILLTVIDGGTPPYPSNASVVSFVSGEDTTSVLCGFTIKNGKGTLYESAGWLTKAGGGVFIKNSGAKIIHNHITQNHLAYSPLGNIIDAYDGAGIAVAWFNNSDWVIIEHNTVDYNSCINNAIESGGAGIWLCCNARIKDNLVSNNTCTGQQSCYSAGAGIWCNNSPDPNSSFTLLVQGNTISSNHAVADSNYAAFGGALYAHVTCVFLDNNVTGNEAHDNYPGLGGAGGVGMLYPQAGTIVSGTTFSGNISNGWCGALDFETNATEIEDFRLKVENNFFMDNQAERGGAIADDNVPVCLQNNVFSGNSATKGGAVILTKEINIPYHHLAVLINNSFYENKAVNGGAIFSSYTKPLVFNSIFWQDSATVGPEIYNEFTNDTVEIANSDIDFNRIYGRINDGGENINQDPLYDDLDLLTLVPYSPCIDDGIKIFICDCGLAHNCPSYDIDFLMRPDPWSEEVDMGAHEYGSIPWTRIKDEKAVSRQSSVVSYPNPFSSFTTIEFELEHAANINLAIFNHVGQQVAVLANEQQTKGKHQVQWNAEGLPAGVYYYRLTTIDYRMTTTGKLVIAR